MDHPSFDVLDFLDEPGRPASVATVTSKGYPALAMMWFFVAEDRLWFHTPGGGDIASPFLRAAAGNRDVAVMIATFDPPDDVRQVRMTGPARLEARDDRRSAASTAATSAPGRLPGRSKRRLRTTSCGRCPRSAAWRSPIPA